VGVPYLDVLELWPQLKEGFVVTYTSSKMEYYVISIWMLRVFIDEQQTVVV
jgi:hypothetical protein